MRIKKGDQVRVLAGKDKGREGEISRVIPQRNAVIIEGVNEVKRHQKATSETMQGGIIDKTMPIDVSNVAILSPSDGKPTRVGYRFSDSGEKIRVCKRTGVDLDG
ncbi:MAG: 50S ribosomal protein L24 [Actinomycetota bacterium]|nr:50S ribosomal protein L24 [Acidimicrobiaceae bacterium]MCH2620174.1 50S ribosomal protein L24 [Acidimicrobiales bacterium]MEC7898917.1 50S ribosomal protein L24 [Actinomycetota bacterium]